MGTTLHSTSFQKPPAQIHGSSPLYCLLECPLLKGHSLFTFSNSQFNFWTSLFFLSQDESVDMWETRETDKAMEDGTLEQVDCLPLAGPEAGVVRVLSQEALANTMSASILGRCYPEQKEAQVPWHQVGSEVETTQTLTGRHPPGAGWNRCSQPHTSHATPEDMVGAQPTLGESVFPSCLTANKGKRGRGQAAALGIGHSGRERENPCRGCGMCAAGQDWLPVVPKGSRLLRTICGWHSTSHLDQGLQDTVTDRTYKGVGGGCSPPSSLLGVLLESQG